MHTVSLILSGVFLLAMFAIIAPGVLALNRGKVLRNVAIWLAIIAALGLYYYNFGPGKNAFQGAPVAVQEDAPPAIGTTGGDKGFTPPKD